MSKRVLIVVIAAALATGAALFALRPERGAPDDAPLQDQMATSVGTPVMTHLVRGHVPGRSGEVLLVPKPHNFLLGRWDLTTLGTDQPVPGSSHPNPWDYLAEVPIVLAGPGIEARVDNTPVDITDLAPTYARMLGMEGFSAEGVPLPGIETDEPPKVIFTVVVDGGGWNVLREHPQAWPHTAAVMERGTTFTEGTIGSAPSITGALHASFGTGTYPRSHGIPGNQLRDDAGENQDAYLHDADPRFLREPTVSELWDEQNDNRALVGTVSYEGWHLGMIGHGAQRDGGDRDIGVLWHQDREEWWTNEDYYELPPYLQTTDIARLERYEDALDIRDGREDGRWFTDEIDQLREPNIRPGTPAFARLTGDAVVEVIRREPLGSDGITDLFWVEMKMPDYAGHRWNMISPEEEDVYFETDAQIGRFIEELDRKIGRSNYIFAISADHGQEPLPEVSGGWRVNSKELESDLITRFGEVVEKVTTVDIYFDQDKVEAEGVDLEDVARYLATYTIGDNIPEGEPGAEKVPDERMDEKLFAGVFTSDYLTSLTPELLAGFGSGDYPEGDLSLTDR